MLLLGYTQQLHLSLVAGVYQAAVFVTCCWGIHSSSICHLLLGHTQQQYLLVLLGYTQQQFCHLLLGYTQQQYLLVLLGYTVYPAAVLSLDAGVYPAAVIVPCCWGIPSSSICHLLLGHTQQQYLSLVAGVCPNKIQIHFKNTHQDHFRGTQ